MICHVSRCAFVHIPKTGGQSIEQYFLTLNGLSKKHKHKLCISRNTDPQRGPARLAHMRAHEYVDCGYLSAEQYKSYFSFSFVRNPWERLVSEYLHKKLDNKYCFKDFVFRGLPQRNDFDDAYRHIIPQTDYLLDAEGRQFVDFIGRFEYLQDDFAKVCERLGFNDTQLPHINSTSSLRRTLERKCRHLFRNDNRIKQRYWEYYDDATVKKVAQMYGSDIEMFGYRFK